MSLVNMEGVEMTGMADVVNPISQTVLPKL